MEKKVLNEIDRYRELMGINNINESKINEVYPVISDTFSNVSFSDGIVGSSTPTKDKVNPALLKDIQTAAAKANVKIDVTTAVSGHRKGTRHEKGQAVDIARFYNDKGNPVGYIGVEIAKKKGIYDKIMAFVSALESMGYKKNADESTNQKVVLTFGVDDHHHHVHVSNTTGTPSETTITPNQKPNQTPTEDLPTPDNDEETSDTTSPWDIEGSIKSRMEKVSSKINDYIKKLTDFS